MIRQRAHIPAATSPYRHLRAAEALGVNTSGADPEAAGDILAKRVIEFMRMLEMPNGLAAVGYRPTVYCQV